MNNNQNMKYPCIKCQEKFERGGGQAVICGDCRADYAREMMKLKKRIAGKNTMVGILGRKTAMQRSEFSKQLKKDRIDRLNRQKKR